jgi:hypothetical protein
MQSPVTREAWLLGLVDELRPYFGRHKAAIPKQVRVTCGWTGKGAQAKRIGECWGPATAADGVPHLYISPVLDDPAAIAHVLVHELVHAAVGNEAHHGREFGRVAKRLGLVGKMTSTTAGPELATVLAEMTAKLGPYSHSRVTPGGGHDKKQSARMIKLACPTCGYAVRTTSKWILVGLPMCPTCPDTMLQPIGIDA